MRGKARRAAMGGFRSWWGPSTRTWMAIALLFFGACLNLVAAVDSDSDDDRASVSTSLTLAALTVMAVGPGIKAKVCKLCKCKSTDASPFDDADPSDKWGGLRPWCHYCKVDGEAGCKTPVGRMCMICYNVFRTAGTFVFVFS